MRASFATLVVGALASVTACNSPSPAGSSDVELVSSRLLQQAGPQVAICHFPPGASDRPQVIVVGAAAANAHLKNHDGDGVVGVDYDESCQPAGPEAVITDFALTAHSPSYVEISWIVVVEREVDVYIIDRRLSSSSTFEEGVAASFPAGEGALHVAVDTPPSPGSYVYRLRARFAGPSFEFLAEDSVVF